MTATAFRTPTRPRDGTTRSAPAGQLAALAQALALAVLIVVCALAFAPAYGGYRWLVAAVGGALLGTLIAWGTSVLRLHWAFSLLAAVVAYLLFGAALATPDSAIGGVFPSLESVRLLTLAVLTSWRQMLTVAVPVGSSGALLVPVYLTALVLALAATTVICRTRRPLFALLAPAGMLVMAALFGTTESHLPLVSGGVLAIGGLLWASAVGLAGPNGARLDVRRPVSGVLVIVAAVTAVPLVSGPVAPVGPRLALRTSVIPPLDPQVYPSPLSGFRNYVGSDAQKKVKLFTVTGLPAETKMRLAALDQYDGVAFTVTSDTGAFRRVGDRIAEDAVGPTVSGQLTVEQYQGVYLPAVGYLTGIKFGGDRASTLTEDFRYATGSAVGVDTSGLREGDSYDFDAVVPPVPSGADLTSAVVNTATGLAAPAKIADAARTAATKYADTADGAYAKAMAMANGLKAAGHLSHGSKTETLQSASGHGIDRLTRLLNDPQVIGDQEQFAPALSMMLWSQGIPNRVVMGFTTGKTVGQPVTVTGGDVTAWVEVPFVGQGWLAFDPTPDQTSKAPQPNPKQQAAPKPQVVQPPPPPPPPGQAKTSDVDQSKSDPKNPDEDKKKDDRATVSGRSAWWGVGFGVGGLLLLVAASVSLVLWLKARRRSRRRHAPTGPERIAGGWNQMLDGVVDFGYPVPAGLTRAETAATIDATIGGGTALLARQADARIFGPADVDEAEAERFWGEVDEALLGLTSGRSWWRRTRAKLSLRSLRRRDPKV